MLNLNKDTGKMVIHSYPTGERKYGGILQVARKLNSILGWETVEPCWDHASLQWCNLGTELARKWLLRSWGGTWQGRHGDVQKGLGYRKGCVGLVGFFVAECF